MLPPVFVKCVMYSCLCVMVRIYLMSIIKLI